MPKTPKYLVVDIDNEAVVATGADPKAAIKDLETAIDADPEDSWAESYVLCQTLNTLKVERRPYIVSAEMKPKPAVKKTKKTKQKNGHPRHRKNCKNPVCKRGFLGRKTQKFCSQDCSNYFQNTIRNYLLAVDHQAHLVNHTWLKDHPVEIFRVQKSCMDPKNNSVFARRVRVALQNRKSKEHERGQTILKNTPTASPSV